MGVELLKPQALESLDPHSVSLKYHPQSIHWNPAILQLGMIRSTIDKAEAQPWPHLHSRHLSWRRSETTRWGLDTVERKCQQSTWRIMVSPHEYFSHMTPQFIDFFKMNLSHLYILYSPIPLFRHQV